MVIEKKLLKAKEVVQILNISLSTVYGYAESGILKPIFLPSIKPSQAKVRNRKSVRFSVDNVQEFLHNLAGWSRKEGG